METLKHGTGKRGFTVGAGDYYIIYSDRSVDTGGEKAGTTTAWKRRATAAKMAEGNEATN